MSDFTGHLSGISNKVGIDGLSIASRDEPLLARTFPYASMSEAVVGSLKEISRQLDKWGPQYHTPHEWYAIVAEEDGEMIKAINEQNWQEAKKECIETIACLMQLYHELENRNQGIEKGNYTSVNTSS